MSAESAHHINGKRGIPGSATSRRPATRIALGVLVALAYVGILAGAGFFISGAVNSMNENTAVARATIDAFREPARGADPAVSGASEAQAAQVAAEPWRPPAAPPLAPPRDTAPAAPAASPAPAPAVAPVAPPDSPHALFAPPDSPPGGAAAAADAAPAAAPLGAAAIAAPAVAGSPMATTSSADQAMSRDLEARGDERLEQGDVASARLFFERAAGAGSALAARRLGNSFDPAFLARWGVRFMRPDPAEAARWYRRADTLGDGEAAQDLAALPQH